MRKIQDQILKNFSRHDNGQEFASYGELPQFNSMGKKLRDDVLIFSEEIQKFPDQIWFQRSKIVNLISEQGKPFLELLSLKLPPTVENVEFSKSPNRSPIYFRYVFESDDVLVKFTECFLQEKSPTELLKGKVAIFQEDHLAVEFHIRGNFGKKNGWTDYHKNKPYSKVKNILTKIFSEVNESLNQDKSYMSFRAELNRLRKKAEDIASRLNTYVNKYYPKVNI